MTRPALVPGREVTIAGVRGRFTVTRVDVERGEVTCYGGPIDRSGHPTKAPGTRTFAIARVKVVHRTTRRRHA